MRNRLILIVRCVLRSGIWSYEYRRWKAILLICDLCLIRFPYNSNDFPFQKNMTPTNLWPVSMWKLASHRSRNLENTWISEEDTDILEYLDFLFSLRILQPVILICKFMTADTGTIPPLQGLPVSQLQFNDHYKGQLDQLPPSIKKKYGYVLQPKKTIHYLSNRPVVSIQILTPCSQRKSIDTTRKKIVRSSRLKQIPPLIVLAH